MNRKLRRASDLTSLLDALENELLAAPATELRDAQRATGRAWETSCQEIRSLLERAGATADEEAGATMVIGPGLSATKHWH